LFGLANGEKPIVYLAVKVERKLEFGGVPARANGLSVLV
jgi:hypothetical protein